MKRHLILILFLVVTVPLIALSWIGYRMLEDEQGLIESRINQSITEDLQSMIDGFAAEMEAVRQDLAENVEVPSGRIKHPAYVKALVIIDESDRRTYPYGPISRALTERVAAAVSDIRMMQENIQQLALQKYLRTRSGNVLSYDGWYLYTANGRESLIYWEEIGETSLAFALLDQEIIIKDMAGEITSPIDNMKDQAIILWAQPSGKKLYQWGDGPENMNPEKARLSMSLAFPLGHYRLAFYTDAGPDFSRSLQFQLFLQVGAVAFILFFLVVYIYDAMREANKKVSFVNQVSHELKTPLTNIRMYAELLEGAFADEDSAEKRKLDIIQYECQRLSRLINNVLTLSHKNALKPKLENHDVDTIIGNVIEGFMPSFEQNNIRTELDLNAGVCMVDKDGLEQALINLVSNVEKYAAAGGFIGVKSRQKDGRLLIRVWDKGPGIPIKMKERIFKPFFRMQNSVTEGVSGAGIGLALARDLIRKSGGELRLVESKTGACFEVVI